MYLKSIDILGYKSFALKTHVDLEPGITGIIGPNGCGKSNIMESVRWCLGEMSWKSLRADAMTDVIFSGTAKRQPLSMTEVTLTFDNASQLLPVQYSEVTVTRRIYRSGESAYFLNKTQCRLRDIREMFLDTGVGGDGYAIIDQGGVDAMIMAKPEERRAFFEEAAGVAKYNAKRDEAIRKLERVEMDMGRLQDAVSLINEQVKKLDNDARKAKLFQKYKEELASAEAAHILQQIGGIQKELETLYAEVKPLEEQLGAQKAEMTAEGANLAAHNLEKANQQNQLIECNQRLSEVKAEIGRLEERVASAEASGTEMDARAAACGEELQGMKARAEAIVPEIERAAAAAAEAEQSRAAAQAESDGWHEQLDALKARLAEAEAQLAALKQASLRAAEEALAHRRKVAEAESSWTREEMRVRGSLKELERDLSQRAACEAELAPAREALASQRALVEAATAEQAAAETLLSELRLRLTQLSDETMRLHSELAQHRARAESLEAQGGQNPYWVGAQACVNAGLAGVHGIVRQLFKLKDESSKPFFEDLLGEKLYAVVVEDSLVARQCVELLEASGKGRARFLVLSALSNALADAGYPEEAKPLLSQIEYEPKDEKAVRFLLAEGYVLNKTLFTGTWVFGGSAERESLQLSLADVQEIKSKASACQARTEALAAEREAVQGQIGAAEQRLRTAAQTLTQESGREHSLAAQIAEKESSLNAYIKNAELSTSEAARQLAEMALIREKIKELRAGIAACEQSEVDARNAESQAASAMGAIREELAAGQATQSHLQAALNTAAEKVSFLQGAQARLVEEKAAIEEQSARRAQELQDIAARKAESQGLIAESKQRLEQLAGDLAARENEAKQVFERLRELEQQISAREEQLRALTASCNEAQEKLHSLELRVSSQRGTQDVLTKRLWDDWQITVEEAQGKYQGVEVDPERIEFLRKRIVSLGNVNMAAPEEYTALSEKQVFLANQIEDLKKAREDLLEAITKINNATRENFRETFTQVREHFRRLYGVLFEGGEADLVLTDPENFLETGVDIMAQPPGKRLQSISLLSGGEKTLTAIALLFSFFLVKPSPFCMLDEADAALDDANVERFVALLKEFQQRSQFIIVSHNKRTMEAADVIYGVTMEEMGVSQLVSVDFRKKDKKLPAAEAHLGPTTQGPFERVTARAKQATSASATAVAEKPAVEEAPAMTEAVAETETAVEPSAEKAEPAVESQPELPVESPAARSEVVAESPAAENVVEAPAAEPVSEPVAEVPAAVAVETPQAEASAEPAVGMVGTDEAGAEPVAEAPTEPVDPAAAEPQTPPETQL